MLEIEKSCCFFGHKDSPEIIIPKIQSNIETLVVRYGVTQFYVGNNGNFDSMVKSILKEMKCNYPQISYNIVLAYLPKNNSGFSEKNTLYPEGIESVPKRFCISWRNNWMINHSRYVICYVNHITGGAAKFIEIANKKNRIVISLS